MKGRIEPRTPAKRAIGHLWRAALHVALPLALGLVSYVVLRHSDLRLFAWMHWLHLDRWVLELRVAGAPVRAHAPGWLAGSLPDAAWAYAFGAALGLVWRGSDDRAGTRSWWIIGAIVTALVEIGQAAHVIPGVFDPTDLVTMLMAFCVAIAAVAMPFAPLSRKTFRAPN